MNLTDLSYLRSVTDNQNDKMAKHIRMLLTGAPISIQQMDLYSLSKDWNGVKQTAHSLKPQLSYFGARSAEEILQEIERLSGEQTDLERIPGYINNFRNQFDIISAELEAALKEIGQ